tara:strand:+ start:2453 stop:3223 length:771 start_codon:yes stop_codon:yes gene_type:complete
MSLLSLKTKIRKILKEQNSTKCLTSGAIFHTSTNPKNVKISVDMPFSLEIDEEESEILETLLHNAVELVLRPYFEKNNLSKEILISNPPSESYRVKELSKIKNQYNNKFNDEYLLNDLDVNISEMFDDIITQNRYDSCIDLINDFKNDIVDSILYHKDYFNCLRPKNLAKKYNIDFKSDNLASANTSSYPSGHAAQGYYIAYKLSYEFPELKDEFLNLANMISQSRIDTGVHFPSDIEGGKELAKKLYKRSISNKY